MLPEPRLRAHILTLVLMVLFIGIVAWVMYRLGVEP
jgi:hypothetical protein